MDILAVPFGWLMKGCYLLVKNYGIALLLFTIVTRLITLPLNIKQQRSTARMTMIQPELDKLKQKYGKNQEKLNEETMKLYSKYNINPMASCLPALIPIVILYAMIPVVYKPMTYITDAQKDHINADSKFIQSIYTISSEIDTDDETVFKIVDGSEDKTERMKLLEDKIMSDETKYKASVKLMGSLSAEEKERALGELTDNEGLDTFMSKTPYFTANIMNTRYGPEVLFFNFYTKEDGKYLHILHEDVQQEIKDFNYTAFGLDLGKIPSKSDATVIIPILSAVLQLATTIISQIFQKRNNPNMKMQSSMLLMFLAFPLLSLWIGFKFPCALGIYWIYSSLFAVFQTLFLNLIYTPQKINELAEKDAERAKQKRKQNGPSLLEKAIEVRNEQSGNFSADEARVSLKKKIENENDDDDDDDDDGDGSEENRKLTKAQQKELNRKKLNEARRRYAEKYGDEYTEED